MSIECTECGFENENGEELCVMCGAKLNGAGAKNESSEPVTSSFSQINIKKEVSATVQEEKAPEPVSNGVRKFFVNCENSRTRTYVESNAITSYYCEGCKEEHQIEGFFWTVQEEKAAPENNTSAQKSADTVIEQMNSTGGQHMILEDIDTHVKIEISSSGGTFGRYGTFGSDYLQSDPRGRMVSGEHCRFKYEYGRWSVEHLSRTNDTVYNGRKLEHGFEEAVRDGKIITLANAMSFIVRIF